MAQLDHAIDVFERRFPDKIAVFLFDHSSNHCAYPADALRASQLLWGDKSEAKKKPAPSRAGWYMKDGAKVVQEMNHSHKGTQQRRGMQSLLTERGKMRKELKMVCDACTKEKSRGFKGEVDGARNACCARRIFETEPDFLEQKSCLEEVGHTHTITPTLPPRTHTHTHTFS